MILNYHLQSKIKICMKLGTLFSTDDLRSIKLNKKVSPMKLGVSTENLVISVENLGVSDELALGYHNEKGS